MKFAEHPSLPNLRVQVQDGDDRLSVDYEACIVGMHIKFDSSKLATYFFAEWDPLVYDAFLLAASIEYCDRRLRRKTLTSWRRNFELRIPVHDPSHWNKTAVIDSLTETIEFLTGDRWRFVFVSRKTPQAPPVQSSLRFKPPSECMILPFSGGLDSQAVAGLLSEEFGERLVLVRLGSKIVDRPSADGQKRPFRNVPYKVCCGVRQFAESSVRSRGFKFTLVSGLAAFLAASHRVSLPESGQGALGPALVPVGQIYEDYRNHPAFTHRMSTFLEALLDHHVSFEFPRLWCTKAETLRAYVEVAPWADWANTFSCWRDARTASAGGARRQCGICAACMLRRMSVHAAGLTESPSKYVWERLGVSDFEHGRVSGPPCRTTAQRDYSIAGALHMDHLAEVADSKLHAASVETHTQLLAEFLPEGVEAIRPKLARMLRRHKDEWENFKNELGRGSFVVKWMAA